MGPPGPVTGFPLPLHLSISTCFGQLWAHHQEKQLCFCDIWYLLLSSMFQYLACNGFNAFVVTQYCTVLLLVIKRVIYML
jgi:hypothetical protein